LFPVDGFVLVKEYYNALLLKSTVRLKHFVAGNIVINLQLEVSCQIRYCSENSIFSPDLRLFSLFDFVAILYFAFLLIT